MPLITSDDDVLAYQPRWQGPPGIARLKRGLLYSSVVIGFATLLGEGVMMLLLVLVNPLIALLVAVLVSVPLVLLTITGRQQRQLAGLALLTVLVGGTAFPVLVALLAPFPHVLLMVRAAEKYLSEPDQTISQRLAVLNAEARYPRLPTARRLPPQQAVVHVEEKEAVTRWT